MVTRTLYGVRYGKYNYSEFICDSQSDIGSLPTTASSGSGYSPCCAGSVAIVVSGSMTYMLNHNNEWIKI